MRRWYDFEHLACGHVHDETVEVPAGEAPKRTYRLDCPGCGATRVAHLRVPSAPAKYLGERKVSPRISGGTFDTMGYEQPKLAEPELPDQGKGDTSAHYSEALDNHFRSPEYRAFSEEQAVVNKRNKQKRKRAKAGVSFKHNPIPGEAKL